MSEFRKEKIRRLLERLWQKTGVPSDLETIILWLRFRSYGQKHIRDLGDFMAHLEQRDRGLTFTVVSDYTFAMDFQFKRVMHRGRVDGPAPGTLEEFKKAAKANFSTFPESELIKEFGKNKKQLQTVLNRGLAKVYAFEGDHARCRGREDALEDAIINLMITSFHGYPYFNEDTLVEELYTALLKNNVCSREEKAKVIGLKRHITLVALEKIHRFEVKISHDRLGYMCVSENDGMAGINVIIPVDANLENFAHISKQFYSTSLEFSELFPSIEADQLAIDRHDLDLKSDWTFELHQASKLIPGIQD